MEILADIGGTHARFAIANEDVSDELFAYHKYKAADFPSLEAALNQYCDEQNLEQGGRLMIATAAYPDGDVWRFVNQNQWVIDAAQLKEYGWDLALTLNDFEAATWGLSAISKDDLTILQSGKKDARPSSRCLLGPGTGLGLGYLTADSHIQRTHGGHMMASAVSDEQHLVIKQVRELLPDNIVVFENLASGLGFHLIYRALCAINDAPCTIESPQDLTGHLDVKEVKDALRLFHEFLGLFAHTAVVTGHAYSGLYLTGGMIDHLSEQGFFDFESFRKYFILPGVESVQNDIANTPISIIDDPYLAMHGLLIAAEKNNV